MQMEEVLEFPEKEKTLAKFSFKDYDSKGSSKDSREKAWQKFPILWTRSVEDKYRSQQGKNPNLVFQVEVGWMN